MARKPGKGRRRIEIKRIEKEEARQVCFSKRRYGVFKKASELSILCGADVAIIVFSPAGNAFAFGHPSVESLVKRFLRQLNPNQTQSEAQLGPDAAEGQHQAHLGQGPAEGQYLAQAHLDRAMGRSQSWAGAQAHLSLDEDELRLQSIELMNLIETSKKKKKELKPASDTSRVNCDILLEEPSDEMGFEELEKRMMGIKDACNKVRMLLKKATLAAPPQAGGGMSPPFMKGCTCFMPHKGL
ncbi:Agamous-like MADS-box protein AGL61 [Acorus gramineus]|uniref:Agamous-like MADS-box protein AGL61 n=1 Tax=Acorus gramineus TaxID=55184 RepID=A0AAV9AYW8_ACOGR|nr:Agamous-like MADS-box protein AGL61 [Acorus gramineus]